MNKLIVGYLPQPIKNTCRTHVQELREYYDNLPRTVLLIGGSYSGETLVIPDKQLGYPVELIHKEDKHQSEIYGSPYSAPKYRVETYYPRRVAFGNEESFYVYVIEGENLILNPPKAKALQ